MKDLVERVASAISDNSAQYEETFEGAARAAIRAVLSHFSEPRNVTKEMRSAAFMHGATVDWNDAGVIASAMRAALEELK